MNCDFVFYRQVGLDRVELATGNWHGVFAVSAPMCGADMAHHFGATSFEITTDGGQKCLYELCEGGSWELNQPQPSIAVAGRT